MAWALSAPKTNEIKTVPMSLPKTTSFFPPVPASGDIRIRTADFRENTDCGEASVQMPTLTPPHTPQFVF